MAGTKKGAGRGKRHWQGMNWCRQSTRLAIYLRDGLACAYCGQAIEDGAQLTLDHLTPHSRGGGNEARNLVTACKRCNSARGNRSVRAFTRATAEYLNHGVTPDEIEKHVRACARRVLPRAEAMEMIARRGSAAAALAALCDDSAQQCHKQTKGE